MHRYPMALTEEEPGVWRTKTYSGAKWFEIRRMLVVDPEKTAIVREAFVGGWDEPVAPRSLFANRGVRLPIPTEFFRPNLSAAHELPEPFAVLRPGDVLTVEVTGNVRGGIGIVCAEVSEKQRYYLSWADENGSRGIAIVEVPRDIDFSETSTQAQFLAAVRSAHELGISPGGQCSVWVVPEFQASVYDDVMDRLLTGEEALRVGARQNAVLLS